MGIFETVTGLPLHPLVIHAVVVLVPLLALAGFAYVLVPGLRQRIAWVTVLLAIGTPLVTLLAKVSGDAFRRRIVRKHLASPSILVKIDAHRSFGTVTLYLTIALALVILVLVLWRSRSRAASTVLSVLTIVLIFLNWIAAGVFIYLLMMDYHVRQEWSYGVFRNYLMMRGLPLEDEEQSPGFHEALPIGGWPSTVWARRQTSPIATLRWGKPLTWIFRSRASS